jgi:glutamate formiminotransferase
MISEESQTKHKGGRPKMPVKKESATGVRFTKSEYFIIKHKAQKAGLKVRQLVGISNNLNQLTKKAHQAGIQTIKINLEQYTNTIDELLLQLKK